MVELAEPVTRLSSADALDGCWMLTAAPAPIEKLCQLTMAVGDDCWIVIAFAPGTAMPTVPCATDGPAGSSPATLDPSGTRQVLASNADQTAILPFIRDSFRNRAVILRSESSRPW